MLLVAVAWIYVVGLMAATQPSFIAGFFTFLFYCVVPLSILFYLTGGRRRRAKRERLSRPGSGDDSGQPASSTHRSDDRSDNRFDDRNDRADDRTDNDSSSSSDTGSNSSDTGGDSSSSSSSD